MNVAMNNEEIIVIGQGFVGLTLSVFLALNGKKVIGIESNLETCEMIRSGQAHFYEYDLNESLSKVIEDGFYEVYNSIPEERGHRDRIYFLTVGTPFVNGEISSIALESALASIFSQIRSGDCIVVRSTVGIGMTRRLIEAPLTAMGIRADVVFAPERTIEGIALNELAHLPQVIGGDKLATTRIQNLFSDVGVDTVILDNLEGAEFAKLMSNSFRDLLFGISNEYAMFADHLGLDFNDILLKSKIGYDRLSSLAIPGPVAGPCLSKDPKIFFQCASNSGFKMGITESSRDQNVYLAKHIVNNILSLSVHSKIGILGLAFKGNPETNDTRDSFVNLILQELSIEDPISEVLLWDPLNSKLYQEHLYGAEYAELPKIIDECDVIILQNSSRYFSSPEFFEQLIARTRPENLIVYQLWNSLPLGAGVNFEVRALGSFNHQSKCEKN
jgi:UDP-N-acetyl-D-mannosaminuronic acid dehydrogenase